MLHAVRYVKAAGGIDRMLDVVGGAQQDHFPGGTQQIADKMAADLGERVRLDAAVSRIEWSDDAVAVTSTAGVVEARRAIVAIPPAHRLAVDIAPAPPIEYQQLAQRWPQGALSKAYAVYDTPVLARRRTFGSGAVRRGAGVHHLRRQPRRRRAGRAARLRRLPQLRRPSTGAAPREGARRASPRCSGRTPRIRSSTSTTVGAQSLSRPAGRRRRCRRDRGPSSARCCAGRSVRCTGRAPRPPTSGRVSWTARSAPVSARPPRCTGNCRRDFRARPPRWQQRSGADAPFGDHGLDQ